MEFPVKVSDSHDKGRILIVTHPIKAGEVLLRQRPYASILSSLDGNQGAGRCDFCLKACGHTSRCGKCKVARYCSRDHQAAAWKAGHARECKALCALQPRTPPPTVRLAARALWRAHTELEAAKKEGRALTGAAMHAGSGSAAAKEGGSWADVQGLVHHWDRLEDSQKTLFAQMAAFTRQLALLGLPPNEAADPQDQYIDTLPSVGDTALLLARLSANAHTMCDDELRAFGSGLYPLASMANHGCNPSAMQSFVGDTLTFRALRPMSEGEEVTIAYTELAATRRDRQEDLWERYGFDIDSSTTAEKMGGLSVQGENGSSSSSDAAAVGQSRPQTHSLLPPPLAEQTERISLDFPDHLRREQSFPDQRVTRIYSLHASPPWPCDPLDSKLTQLVLCTDTSAAGSSGRTLLPGGVQVCVHAGRLRDQQQDVDPSASFEGFGSSAEESGGPLQQQNTGKQQQQKKQRPCIQVDMWGPWWEASLSRQQQQQDKQPPKGTSEAQGSVQLDVSALAQEISSLECSLLQAEMLIACGSARQAIAILKMDLRRADGMPVASAAVADSEEEVLVALGPLHGLRIRQNTTLLRAAVEAQNFGCALDTARLLSPMFEQLYPPIWPNTGLHLAQHAKLAMLLEFPAEAASVAEKALRILCITHVGSSVCDEVARIRYEAEQEVAAGV